MIYFILWAAFLGILVLATILTAVMGKKSSSGRAMVAPTGNDYADDDAMDEAYPDESTDMQEASPDASEEFATPAGDDFAEFESEFK